MVKPIKNVNGTIPVGQRPEPSPCTSLAWPPWCHSHFYHLNHLFVTPNGEANRQQCPYPNSNCVGLKSHVYLGCGQRTQSNKPWVMCTRPLRCLPSPVTHALISLLAHLHGCALLGMVSWGTNHSKAILQMTADSGKQ